LIEQRLEKVVVMAVDHDHVDRRIGEPLGRRQTPKARADNDDVLTV